MTHSTRAAQKEADESAAPFLADGAGEPVPAVSAEQTGGPSIAVRNVSLVFPLYERALPAAPTREDDDDHAGPPPAEDERILLSPDGGIIGVRAVHDVSFDIGKGERVALIGKNGAGKTTLLQILAGILTPDEGEVRTCGRTTNLIRINLGMRGEASGHRNITLLGLAAGHAREEIEAKREQIAAFSELGRFLDMPVETYSAGMRMRLNFAIATAFEPEILILDEWLSAGDAAFRKKATERMQEFVGTANILIFASHSRRMLLDNCTRGIWLERGRIRADGDIEDLLDAYEAESGASRSSA
ncbi:ABC transporter ATP-binding protein [Amphiplicatus metriothermophilus]|nr:ABC transporter ATP-binding protein [Amphiplicatus metriothermophilus]